MVGAILVLYNPDIVLLKEVLNKLIPQVDKVCIIDNSFINHSKVLIRMPKLYYIPLLKNMGIATAQNIGINYFLKINCEYVVFLDQDSILSEGVILKLSKAYTSLVNCGYKVAAVGTRAINRQTNKKYRPKSKEFRTIKGKNINYTSNLTECYSLISSVSMIPLINFKIIGGMDESLFIDGVDHEWCWRAWHTARLRCFIVENALIYHQLGEGDKKILNKEIAVPSAFRLYYQFRNYLWLCKRDYVPLFWKTKHFFKYMIKLFYFSFFISSRGKCIMNICRGIYDGLHNNKEIKWPDFHR